MTRGTIVACLAVVVSLGLGARAFADGDDEVVDRLDPIALGRLQPSSGAHNADDPRVFNVKERCWTKIRPARSS